MATIRDVFLIDLSLYADFDVIYCVRLKNIQDMLNKLKKGYLPEVVDMSDNTVYTSDIIMDLNKAMLKLRKAYIPPKVVDMSDNTVYTSDIIMDLNKAMSKFRKVYIPPDIPKLVVDS